ncbi:MAG: hypothetical protein GX895_05920 [Clostridiales bacterium]|uniref:DUF6323 family protein n=1 Tax=Clostridium sp. N3C TaxID=1776758 RepID=UPI00092E0967|nr:DUF6323 family protein [Clostridium sp. N3C]NLZ48320.1 hypothetical protein [Clostridiales bacterium]SCN21538.1 hypothetical protein N3C_0299 [Clostridium sp. N3C]
MTFGIMNLSSSLIEKHAVDEIVKCNDITLKFGLSLTLQEAMELVKTRTLSLKCNGRIEFGGGVIGKIIKEFCDSPYIYKANYVETLNELIEIFYYYKNETLDLISDNELIAFMKNAFDGKCQGSLELLYGRELEKLAHNLRYGYGANYSEYADCEEENDDDQY